MNTVVEDVSFESEGYRLLGRLYRPNTSGRFPAVVICLGFPGDNKNMDLAEELALNGIVCLIFYYRGAWGSGGDFGLKALDPSARDAVEFLVSQSCVDPGRVGLIGYSMGALPAVKRLSLDRRLKVGVLISPIADVSAWAVKEVAEAIIPIWIQRSEGKLKGLDAEHLISELPSVVEELNPVEVIRETSTPIMIVAGSEDTLTPHELCREVYEAAIGQKDFFLVDGADHEYSAHRVLLIRRVLEWLKKHL